MGLRYSDLTNRLNVQTSDVWGVHTEAHLRAAACEDIIMLSLGQPDLLTPQLITD